MAKAKQQSNPASTGGEGPAFEVRVQAALVATMLAGGQSPGLPTWPITSVKLQTKYTGLDTDDLIITVEQSDGVAQAKLWVSGVAVRHSPQRPDPPARFRVLGRVLAS